MAATIIQPEIDRAEAVELWNKMKLLINFNAKTPTPNLKIHAVCTAVAESATALIKAVDDYADVSNKCMSGSYTYADIQRGMTASNAYEDAVRNLAEAKRYARIIQAMHMLCIIRSQQQVAALI